MSPMKTWMTLGRVSNLPTVWTNTLAAALLASSAGAPGAAVMAGVGGCC